MGEQERDELGRFAGDGGGSSSSGGDSSKGSGQTKESLKANYTKLYVKMSEAKTDAEHDAIAAELKGVGKALAEAHGSKGWESQARRDVQSSSTERAVARQSNEVKAKINTLKKELKSKPEGHPEHEAVKSKIADHKDKLDRITSSGRVGNMKAWAARHNQ